MLYKLQSLFTTRKGLLRLLLVIVIIAIVASIPVLYKYEWSGFGEDSNKSESTEETLKDGKVVSTKKTTTEHFQSPKTLWDWLGLGGTIAIPVMLYIFQAGEQRRADKRANVEKEAADKRAEAEKQAAAERANAEKEIADGNLREEALQAYIDRMAEILIDKERRLELLPNKNNGNNTDTDNPVRDVARVRTTTILRRLEGDKERQGYVLDFLRDSELLYFLLRGANLKDVDLRGANLGGANLGGANLGGANLGGANLTDTNLTGAILEHGNLIRCNLMRGNLTGINFTGTYLIRADLTGAKLNNAKLNNAKFINTDLTGADFTGADFNNANLEGANLNSADLENSTLEGARNLTVEQIKAAKNWETAKYDPEFRSLLGLPPETSQSSGADTNS